MQKIDEEVISHTWMWIYPQRIMLQKPSQLRAVITVAVVHVVEARGGGGVEVQLVDLASGQADVAEVVAVVAVGKPRRHHTSPPVGVILVAIHNGSRVIQQGDGAVQMVVGVIQIARPVVHHEHFIDVVAVNVISPDRIWLL